MFLVDGKPLPFELAQASGKSIGTPALIPMLKLAHEQHGKLPWATLFEPAIRLAEDGFVVGPRLSRSLLNTTRHVRRAIRRRGRSISMRQASRGRRAMC